VIQRSDQSASETATCPVCQLRVVVSVQGGTQVVGGSASLCKHTPSTNDNRWMSCPNLKPKIAEAHQVARRKAG
jgi:hypothetical protein